MVETLEMWPQRYEPWVEWRSQCDGLSLKVLVGTCWPSRGSLCSWQLRLLSPLTVEGNSDELDEPIKTVCADVAFVKKHNLMSLNSINWSRVLVQIAHHFFAYFRCAPSLDMHPLSPVEVVVPTGAAGNLAGEKTPGWKWAFQKNACGPCPPSHLLAIT